MSAKKQLAFFSIMIILINNFLCADEERSLNLSSALLNSELSNNFSELQTVKLDQSEKFVPCKDPRKDYADDPELRSFCQKEFKRLMEENSLNPQLFKSVSNDNLFDQKSKEINSKKEWFDIAPEDTLECNKVAGLSGLFIASMTSLFLKKTTSYKVVSNRVETVQASKEEAVKEAVKKVKTFRPLLRDRVKVLCKNGFICSVRTCLPIGMGFATYTLILGNQKVKQSLCNGLERAKDSISNLDSQETKRLLYDKLVRARNMVDRLIDQGNETKK